ncbi:MAG: hypothetical protein AAF290_15175 [Pseudomonadota bacterium]
MAVEAIEALASRTRAKSGNPFQNEWRALFRRDPDGLRRWLLPHPLDYQSVHFEIYESLATLRPAPLDFLIGEYERLLALATKDSRNPTLYSTLESMAFLAGSDDATRRLVQMLSPHLSSPVSNMRRYAAYQIADFVQPDDTATMTVLTQLATSDKDWLVRVCAHLVLAELHSEGQGFPPPPALSVADRIRMWFRSPKNAYLFHK